jgi:hypothetical protein
MNGYEPSWIDGVLCTQGKVGKGCLRPRCTEDGADNCDKSVNGAGTVACVYFDLVALLWQPRATLGLDRDVRAKPEETFRAILSLLNTCY